MTTTSRRAEAQHVLASARAELQAGTANVTEAELQTIQITLEWDAMDILRHISVWAELVVRCLDDWTGQRDWVINFSEDPDFNVDMVNQRRTLRLEQLMNSIRGFYDRYARVLEECTDEELEVVAPPPWGGRLTRAGMIINALTHDREHLAQLIQARRGAGAQGLY
ncbi:MAG: hypothetical protein OHK0022_07010 [Roseiflexaceae bacterium]